METEQTSTTLNNNVNVSLNSDQTSQSTIQQTTEFVMASDVDLNNNTNPILINNNEPYIDRVKDVFISFIPLGLLAFGGPTAHIAILHERFVENKKWFDNERFIELLAVGQGLPGPTSTQMVISCGAYRAGILGGIIAFLCWNIPSFIVLTSAGLGINSFLDGGTPNWMSGLAPAAVSLVFVAAYKLSNKILISNGQFSRLKVILCLLTTIIVLIINGDKRVSARATGGIYPALIFGGGLVTDIDSKITSRSHLYDHLRSGNRGGSSYQFRLNIDISKKASLILFIGWLLILFFFMIARADGAFDKSEIWKFFESLFRIGSIIYGGGQVVLPMLLTEVVNPGWVTEDQFWQGFAIVQALPGPLFNFSSFLGAVSFGIQGAFIGWMALFGPGLLLIFAFLPLWEYIHKWEWVRIVLQGVNSSAIGLVIAACQMLWKSAVNNYSDASIAIFTATLVVAYKIPAPIAILSGGVLGCLLSNAVFGIGQDDICEF